MRVRVRVSDSREVSDVINVETDIDLTIYSESIHDVGILDRETTTNSVDSSKTIHQNGRRLYELKGLGKAPYRKKNNTKLVSSEFLPLDHQLHLNVPPSV